MENNSLNTINIDEIEMSDLETILELPDHLRTEHFYNDVQHSMLVILFRYALKSIRCRKAKFVDLLVDNITIYLYIHFLAEEEAMTYSMSREVYARENLTEHMRGHLSFLDFWVNDIFMPYKRGELSNEECYQALSEFYGKIIGHIDGVDQCTYGVKQEHVEKNLRAEAAWVASTHIPLSPHTRGAFEVLKLLNKEASRLINHDKLSSLATEALPEIHMVSLDQPVLDGPVRCLRDQFYDKANSKPEGVDVLQWIAA